MSLRKVDMLSGSLVKNIFIFTIPLILTALLQLIYHTADLIVLSDFSSEPNAMAAVGATTAISALVLNLFLGLSLGVNIVSSRYFGNKNDQGLSRTTHTAIILSVTGGIVFGLIGFLLAPTLLQITNVPEEIVSLSTLYMRIIFAGMPMQMLYNFGASLLRSVGETKKPLYILIFTGLLNVGLNLFFVLVCNMSVDGVAIATVVSQSVSAVIIVILLAKSKMSNKLYISKIRFHANELKNIVRFGLPAGIQTALFSVANTIIQSQVNTYGANAIAGNIASCSLEDYCYTAIIQFSTAALTFTAANIGAKQFEKIPKITVTCLTTVFTIGLGGGILLLIFGEPLCRIFVADNTEALEYALIRLSIFASTFFLCAMYETVIGQNRAMGASLSSMIISLFGIIGTRMIWIFGIYPFYKTIFVLYLVYPVSWFIVFIAQLILYFIIYKKKKFLIS